MEEQKGWEQIQINDLYRWIRINYKAEVATSKPNDKVCSDALNCHSLVSITMAKADDILTCKLELFQRTSIAQ